ncbi:putative sporulation-specific protein 5 protein [Lasiodiplodia theobromae]|nr:putative sporulation-specific protein 5 protein [Lasiodiplodia theobromae]
MAALTDIESQRKRNFGNPAANFGNRAAMYGSYQNQAQRPSFLSTGHPGMLPYHGLVGDQSLAALTQGFAGMNMHPSLGSAKPGSHVPASSAELGGVPLQAQMQHGQHAMVYQQHQMIPGLNNYHGLPSPGVQTPMSHYVPQTAFQYGHQMMDNNSPITGSWASRVSSSEPSLVTPRRDSISSTEQDLPGTPYTGNNAAYHPNVYMNGSPNAIYPGSGTPSPSHLGPFYVPQMNKAPAQIASIPSDIQELLSKDPPIPRAIPAPSSPIKPLDRSLENKNGETNVYIRGLLPETTDEMLHQWGMRFGDIQSSKSIIDVKTNQCKGYGFIKYYNFKDAENCIRGFHYLGYEVSFARESFYAKLKKFSDESNTNLYVSNIPRHINEAELTSIFHPYKVCSSKILRDGGGHGRGVGFARFETRDICEEVIKKFNNTPVSVPDGEDHVIQIRYADTQEQKVLKQQTAAARQFRAAEFEYGVLQSRAANANGGLIAPQQRLSSLTPAQKEASNEFENFLAGSNSQNYPPRYDRNFRNLVARSSQLSQTTTNNNLPSVKVEAEEAEKPRPTTPVIAHGDHSSASSNAPSDRE